MYTLYDNIVLENVQKIYQQDIWIMYNYIKSNIF